MKRKTLTKKDAGILAVVKRAEREGYIGWHALYPDRMTLWMDIESVMKHVPLRLSDWAKSCHLEFVHDLAEIALNLDRRTGKLKGIFHPRFAV